MSGQSGSLGDIPPHQTDEEYRRLYWQRLRIKPEVDYDDLKRYPTWVSAIEHESLPGVDETWMEAVGWTAIPSAEGRQIYTSARVELADGTRLEGGLSLQVNRGPFRHGPDPLAISLLDLKGHGTILFASGAPRLMDQAWMERRITEQLGRPPDAIFPISARTHLTFRGERVGARLTSDGVALLLEVGPTGEAGPYLWADFPGP
jgi:hypothetical protein